MITSLQNKKIKEYAKLRMKKYRQDYFLAGDDTLTASYLNGYLKELFYIEEKPFPFEKSEQVSKEVMAKLSGNTTAQAIGISCKPINKIRANKRYILLDHLQDPLNIGTILYVAKCFGFLNCFIDESADIYHEKALQASHGAIFDINIIHMPLHQAILDLKKDNIKIYATALRENTLPLAQLKASEKMAFILGNEGAGVAESLMELADATIKIEMENIDSLNVAIAGSIIMHQFKI